jgi:ribosome biogenesis GTPase / thiamine phosphate phosphatase
LSRFAALDLGLVVSAHGRHVLIETPEGRRVRCHLRGKKTEAVVGDQVRWLPTGDEGVVERLEPRRNLLYRQDRWRSKSFAANLDRLLVLVAGEPQFSESQLARALIAAAEAGVPSFIVLNKVDLPTAAAARQRLEPYRVMGIDVLEVSLRQDPDGARAQLMHRLSEGSTLVLGASGMGKSTLVNLLVPEAGAQVGEISRALASGRHTTTSSTWYWIDAARRGAVIDSPGFQEFGLHQVGPMRLAELMPDLAAVRSDCRFYNCTHRAEPGCSVRQAVTDGRIAASRYDIYHQLFDELSTAPLNSGS